MSRTDTRRDQAIRLRNAGLTYAEIGRRLDISRERARQLVTLNPSPAKPDLSSKPMLTTSEAAQLLGIHRNTLRKWANQGVITAYRIGPRRDRRFRREDIESFLEESEAEDFREDADPTTGSASVGASHRIS